METAIDLLTGQEFLKKRINQRFSCPENRIKYYNQKANQIRHTLYYINKPLLNNYRILQELMAGKVEADFHKEYLKGKGFDFSIHTHYENYDGKTRNAIYNFIIYLTEKDNIKIIKL